MKGRPISYSAEELAWLHANHTLPYAEYFAAFIAQFPRDDLTAANINSLRKRKGWSTGRTGHFVKGETPHNKGKSCEEGKGGKHPNARKSQFKPGQRQGVAVRLYKPIGTERMSKGGYLERKINDDMPLRARWRAVHLLRWEEQNGPIPKGMALKCLNSDILNTDPSNWELVPRAILPRLNGGPHKSRLAYDAAPPELRPTILLAAKVEHRARQAQEKVRDNG
ncbi:HNH endonuclease [Novosphingobium sp. SG707]|uniref:HNH endonuclease n=1 Tax=Novosphingobium sp. SG707 TaxID=2586996 RepID=UPI0014463AC5|nr:HNH endonuclease [Novosphingobium sp. SG707]NKI99623.1 hypothetical protein [Novosphingobium sp. SG707]